MCRRLPRFRSTSADHVRPVVSCASPQAPEASVLPVEPFADATLRQVVRNVRIRLSNEYGTIVC